MLNKQNQFHSHSSRSERESGREQTGARSHQNINNIQFINPFIVVEVGEPAFRFMETVCLAVGGETRG